MGGLVSYLALIINLMPKGVAFPFLFFPFSIADGRSQPNIILDF